MKQSRDLINIIGLLKFVVVGVGGGGGGGGGGVCVCV
jgi:hypothetical protein